MRVYMLATKVCTLAHTQKKYFSTMKNVDYSSLHKVVFEQNLSTLFLVISFHTVCIDRERELVENYNETAAAVHFALCAL